MTSRLAGARVLLIGEVSDEREMYAEALRLEGICTLQAASASAAVRLADELSPSAIVITGGRLDAAFGTSLMHDLATDEVFTSRPPILVVTSHARPRDVEAVMTAGCDRVFVKPCPPAALIRALDEVIAGAASTPHQ